MRYDELAVSTWTSILTNAALLLAFVEAPFLHVHGHEDTQSHAGPLLHLHLKHLNPAPPDTPGLRGCDPDDDAEFQEWLSVRASSRVFGPVVLTRVFAAPDLEIDSWIPPTGRPAAHGPPGIDARPPRAPPA